jgi:transposase
VQSDAVSLAQTWRTTHGDMTDEEWALNADQVAPYWSPGRMGRPVTVERRRVVDAIFYVAATGCQWRALPGSYPNWNTVHRYHLAWSRDGTWEAIAARLAAAVRLAEGRDPEPSAGGRGSRAKWRRGHLRLHHCGHRHCDVQTRRSR